jgi:hypothetical protein
MDRRTLLWTLTAFFGATVAFNLVANLTEGESAGVRLALQLLTLALVVGLIVAVVRRRDQG